MWERWWEDDAQQWIISPEAAYDPTKIHRIEFNGDYHKMSGFFQTHPSPNAHQLFFKLVLPSPASPLQENPQKQSTPITQPSKP
jgi:hypothetical protein